MEIKQKIEQRRLLIPELRKSLEILSLSSLELKAALEEELISNPFLEEALPKETVKDLNSPSLPLSDKSYKRTLSDTNFSFNLISKKVSLQELLLKQLGISVSSDLELKIGKEIIENIDENGYLISPVDQMANNLNTTAECVENVLRIVQRFEPTGVGARTISECLLIQLDSMNENEPLIRKIIEFHLQDVAKKNYGRIAKALKEPLDKIEPLIKKILKLNPKPGRNYSTEEAQYIIPDIVINQKSDDLEIVINNDSLPLLQINKTYENILKKDALDPQAKQFLSEKLTNALELLKSLSKRYGTLRKIVEKVIDIQQDAVKEGLSHLKPLTFKDVALKLNIHESTVCRAVMNKYIHLPCGTVALKELFSNGAHQENGHSVSSNYIKKIIKEHIDQEDKKRPLSDQDISQSLHNERNIHISRRTITKYREELKILSSSFRRER